MHPRLPICFLQSYFALVEVGKILRNNHVKLNKDHLRGVCDSSWIRWCFHWCSLGFSCKWDATGSAKTQWRTLPHVSNTNSFPCGLKGEEQTNTAEVRQNIQKWPSLKHSFTVCDATELSWSVMEDKDGLCGSLSALISPNWISPDWSPAGHFVFHYRLIVVLFSNTISNNRSLQKANPRVESV